MRISFTIVGGGGARQIPAFGIMKKLKHNLDHNQNDDHPFKTNVVYIVQFRRNQVSQFNAMIQFVVHYLNSKIKSIQIKRTLK